MRRACDEWRARVRTPVRFAACWHSQRSMTGRRALRQPTPAGSHGRSSATGCCGSMRTVRRDWWIARLQGNRLGSTSGTGPRWRQRSTAVQSQRLMVWSAGASSIFANGCGTNFRSLSPSRPSAACCVRWAIASCQHVRAITLKLPAPLRYLKKVPLAVGKHRPQAARRYRRHRGLVR